LDNGKNISKTDRQGVSVTFFHIAQCVELVWKCISVIGFDLIWYLFLRAVTSIFCCVALRFTSYDHIAVGLEVNIEKAKFMLVSRDQNESQFKYLGTTVTNQNVIQEEIKGD
jgi:hypothetical protein